MRAKSLCQQMIIFLSCLMMVAEIQAHCGRPKIGGNRVLTAESDKASFPGGETVTFRCTEGFEPSWQPASRSITCDGKQWSKLQLQCRKKSCGRLMVIPNGKYLYPEGTVFGARATVQCEVGYKLVGENTRNCRDAGWDGRDPVCEVVKCAKPKGNDGHPDKPLEDEYQSGEVSAVSSSPVLYRSCVFFDSVETGQNITLRPGIKGTPESILWKFQRNKVVEFENGLTEWYRLEKQALLNPATGELTLLKMRKSRSGLYECEIEVKGELKLSKYAIKVTESSVDGDAGEESTENEPSPVDDSDVLHAPAYPSPDGRVLTDDASQTQSETFAAIVKLTDEFKEIKGMLSDISVTLKELVKNKIIGQA